VFRNARDRAQERRDAFISAANVESSSPHKLSDHNDASDAACVQDTTHLAQAEDPVDGSQYYAPQHIFQKEMSCEPQAVDFFLWLFRYCGGAAR
jgi:hypothetical protein